jgi:hypothetical protein
MNAFAADPAPSKVFWPKWVKVALRDLAGGCTGWIASGGNWVAAGGAAAGASADAMEYKPANVNVAKDPNNPMDKVGEMHNRLIMNLGRRVPPFKVPGDWRGDDGRWMLMMLKAEGLDTSKYDTSFFVKRIDESKAIDKDPRAYLRSALALPATAQRGLDQVLDAMDKGTSAAAIDKVIREETLRMSRDKSFTGLGRDRYLAMLAIARYSCYLWAPSVTSGRG